MINSVIFSSETDDWATPQEFFDELNRKFDFQLDVAASYENAKCERYFTVADNGLSHEWAARNWMNPPYGRGIGAWCRKAHEEALGGKLTVALLPARVDTRWYHDYCAQYHVIFIRGRLKFGGSKNSAPFPSMLVYFGIDVK